MIINKLFLKNHPWGDDTFVRDRYNEGNRIGGWIEKVIARLNSMSEEGKLANIAEDGEPLTTDFLMEQSMKIGSGRFTYNGKGASAVIAVMPGFLDNSNPDEVMPACTLRLDH